MGRKQLAIALWVFLMILPVFSFAKDVFVEIDKVSYQQGEYIKITLKNHSRESVFSIAASATPFFSIVYIERKNEIGDWDKLPVHCEWPECDSDFDWPAEIKPRQVVSFKWKPQFYQGKKYKMLGEGVYRIAIGWQLRRDADSKKWAWYEAKTYEFSISH